jgi:isocitrate dehydrogenase kinase/phosphatase
MNSSNFGVDQHGKTVLMDFAEIELFPETFVAHTMFSEERLAPIATASSLSDSSCDSMAALSWILWIVNSPKLGASTCT